MNFLNDFRKLKNQELNEQLKLLCKDERALTKNIIDHLAEVDRRKLYLDFAYPSFFDYMTKELGYSAGAAHRRIEASRLAQQLPEISQKLAEGKINLSQISKLQQLSRLSKKESGKPVSIKLKEAVLSKLELQNSADTDFILQKELNIKPKEFDRKTKQQDKSVRVEITFSEKEYHILKNAQQSLSNLTDGSLKGTILALAQKVKPRITSTVEVNQAFKSEANQLPPFKSEGKSLSPKLKQFILHRDQNCQFVNHVTGQNCGSKFRLEIDHIKPRFAGGGHHPENLRVLCKAHNNFRYTHGK